MAAASSPKLFSTPGVRAVGDRGTVADTGGASEWGRYDVSELTVASYVILPRLERV